MNKNVPAQMLKALKKVGSRMKVKRSEETFAYYKDIRQLRIGDKVILSYQQSKIIKEYSMNAVSLLEGPLRKFWNKTANFLGFESYNQMVLEYNFNFLVSNNYRTVKITEPFKKAIEREQKFREEKEYVGL